MSKLKKLALVFLITCVAVCISVAVAACSDKNADYSSYPDVRQPANYVPPEEGNVPDEEYAGKYKVVVQSKGGLNLNGVRVTAMKNGAPVMDGISINGLVEFPLEAGVYQLEVDESSLPEGYYLPDDAEFATVANLARAEIALPSKVIPRTAPANTNYNIGDVMYDFAFTDTNGLRYTLSELLETKKAVMLNFWYTTCNPCKAEFPAIQKAYEAYEDKIAIVAIDHQESFATITKFKQDNNLTFHMCYDAAGTTNMFMPLEGYPTTVIIDRYGVVVYKDAGSKPTDSVWKALFNTYTSDNYIQNPTETPDGPTDRTKPPVGAVMTPSDEVIKAINGVGTQDKVLRYYEETNEKDKEYSWPWVVSEDETGKFLTASNSMSPYSYAIVYADVTMNSGDVLSYEYRVDTEQDRDFLYALIDGSIVGTHSGNSEGWQSATAVYVADHTVNIKLSFIYIKDQMKEDGTDTASVRNINIRPITEIGDAIAVDQRTSVVDDLTLVNGKYEKEGLPFSEIGYTLKSDGYYYVSYRNTNGIVKDAMLLMDMNNATLWSEKHLGTTQFTNAEGNNIQASLYHLSFWLISNYEQAVGNENIPLDFKYYDSDSIFTWYYLQDFSDNQLLPVTPERVAMVKAFIKEMYANHSDMFVAGDEYYEDQWLEMCFFYKHHGLENSEDHICFSEIDPTKALTFDNAYEAKLGYNHADITKILNLGDYGGIKFTFIPDRTGIYFFYSDTDSIDIDPRLIIYDVKGSNIPIAQQNNDTRYTGVSNPKRQNFYVYVYLEAYKTYYVQAAMNYFEETGAYDFYIEYKNTTYYEQFELCTTGEGVFVPDENGAARYEAIPVALNRADGYYHAVTEDYDYGSVIYIDFVHSNFLDQNGHSLEWIINNKNENGDYYFNFGPGMDFTNQMKEYFYRSTAGKSEDDEDYGLIEADQTLVNMLNALCLKYFDEGPESRAWLAFACYKVSYGIAP